MIQGKLLCLFDEDVVPQSKNKTIAEIGMADFKSSAFQEFLVAHLVIYTDKFKKTRVLKNRYSAQGMIVEDK